MSPTTPPEHSDWWPSTDDSTYDQLQQLQFRLFADLLDPSDSAGSSGSNLWGGGFVPPPPRPAFLDENIATDGVTTCDMCSWAWQEDGADGGRYSGRGSGYGAGGVGTDEASGELSWVFTLVIVSLISAVIGAIVMIIVLHCKRIKTAVLNDSEHNATTSTSLPLSRLQRPPMDLPPADNKQPIARPNSYVHHQLHHHRQQPQLQMARSAYGLAPPHSFDMIPGDMDSPVEHGHHLHHHNHHSGVWQWLTRRCSSGSIGGVCANHLLDGRGISPTAAENHYTHMDDTYNIQNSGGGLPASNLSIITTGSQHDQSTSGEALYAELDSTNGDIPTNPCAHHSHHHQYHHAPPHQQQLLTTSSPPPPQPQPPPPPPSVTPFSNVTNNNQTSVSSNQSYPNSAYIDQCGVQSNTTPPSSAYYSDLSVNGNTDRSGASSGPVNGRGADSEKAVYEVVGWPDGSTDKRAGSLRLASISEQVAGAGNNSMPSDYV